MAAVSIAFDAPDNYSASMPSYNRPIDLVHLAHQTAGDKGLELEVLRVFARQARNCMNEIANGSTDAIAQTAHKLKGAALAVGAFNVSRFAEKLEENSADAGTLAQLSAAVVEAENFILKLSR